MNIIIGSILLVYGVAGVIGAFLAYRWLFAENGPFERLRALLQKTADKIQEGKGYVVDASTMVGEASQALQEVYDQLGKTLPPLNTSADALEVMGSYVGSIEDLAINFQVQAPTPSLIPVSFPITYPTVDGISMKKYGEIGGIVIYGPPLSIQWGTETQTLGPVQVPTITTTPVNPLSEVGEKLHSVKTKLAVLYAMIGEVRSRVVNIQINAIQTKKKVDIFNQDVLQPLPQQLNDTRQQVLDLRQDRLLRLTPTGIILYLGLIHVAFALTGIGLIFG